MLLLLLSSGIQDWPDGTCYKGKFVGDYRHGFGQHSWPTGEVIVCFIRPTHFFFTYLSIKVEIFTLLCVILTQEFGVLSSGNADFVQFEKQCDWMSKGTVKQLWCGGAG